MRRAFFILLSITFSLSALAERPDEARVRELVQAIESDSISEPIAVELIEHFQRDGWTDLTLLYTATRTMLSLARAEPLRISVSLAELIVLTYAYKISEPSEQNVRFAEAMARIVAGNRTTLRHPRGLAEQLAVALDAPFVNGSARALIYRVMREKLTGDSPEDAFLPNAKSFPYIEEWKALLNRAMTSVDKLIVFAMLSADFDTDPQAKKAARDFMEAYDRYCTNALPFTYESLNILRYNIGQHYRIHYEDTVDVISRRMLADQPSYSLPHKKSRERKCVQVIGMIDHLIRGTPDFLDLFTTENLKHLLN